MARRVASPDDKVYVVLDIVLDPFERLVDEGEGGVAGRRLCAVDTGGPMAAMAGGICSGARVRLVEGVGMEVWSGW